MTLETLVIWVVVGGAAGWLASQIMKSGGLRLTGNHIADTVITGLIGAVIGGWLLGVLGISLGGGMIGATISAAFGAVVLILGLRLLNR